MSNLGYPLLIVGFMFSLITYTYQNLEYKGYASAHNCSGECYEEYLRVHGTMAEQLAKQQEAAAADPFSSIRGLWAGCAACHGNEGQGMGAFPKLAGQNAEYISQRLYAYHELVDTLHNILLYKSALYHSLYTLSFDRYM